MSVTAFWRGRSWYSRIAIGLGLMLIILLAYARWDSQRGLDVPVAVQLDSPNAGKARQLIVIAHGYARGSAPFDGLRRAIRDAHPDADIMFFEYAAQVFSNASPFTIATQMEEQIREQHGERRYESIRLVGYSMGAVLLRKAYVYGCGRVEDEPFSDQVASVTLAPLDWVRQVDRIVLIAGMNRGWSYEDPPKTMPLRMRIRNLVGMTVGKLSGTGKLVRSVQRGEPFIVNLRLQWLDVMEAAKQGSDLLRPPTVVQLLGSKDEVVSKADDRDVKVAKDFIWVPVHNSSHANIIDIEDPNHGLERKRKILRALGSEADLEFLRHTNALPARDEDPSVTTVVFILHGIRDLGEWTGRLEDQLKHEFLNMRSGGEKLEVVRSSYGYFGMGPFLLMPDRQRNVRWFMDEITEVRSRFPNLRELHFIGHSNGTYILASALERYSTLRVNRVVFAGSVVSTRYDWSRFLKRVNGVRNFVARDDLIVGLFPKLFELPLLRKVDPALGAAGFDGFLGDRFKDLETRYIIGRHGAALHPDNLPGITCYILTGKVLAPPASLYVTERPAWAGMLSQLCWLIWVGLVLIVFFLGRGAIFLLKRNYDRAPRKLSWRSAAAIGWIGYLGLFTFILMTI